MILRIEETALPTIETKKRNEILEAHTPTTPPSNLDCLERIKESKTATDLHPWRSIIFPSFWHCRTHYLQS